VDERAELRNKAQKYRDYMRWINDPEVAGNIIRLADELDRRALEPNEEDVRTRAYDLWRQAGEPEGWDEEFWLLAEQELTNEHNHR
jgi:hypothetical protein